MNESVKIKAIKKNIAPRIKLYCSPEVAARVLVLVRGEEKTLELEVSVVFFFLRNELDIFNFYDRKASINYKNKKIIAFLYHLHQ